MSTYVFLDIDGVLNSTRYWSASGEDLPMGQAGAIDPAAVALVNEILRRVPGTKLVLSSSWRSQGVSLVHRMLRERGLTTVALYATDEEPSPRWRQIHRWLVAHAPTEHRTVILDDLAEADLPGQIPAWTTTQFLQTNYLTGLTPAHVELAVAWLMQEDETYMRLKRSAESDAQKPPSEEIPMPNDPMWSYTVPRYDLPEDDPLFVAPATQAEAQQEYLALGAERRALTVTLNELKRRRDRSTDNAVHQAYDGYLVRLALADHHKKTRQVFLDAWLTICMGDAAKAS